MSDNFFKSSFLVFLFLFFGIGISQAAQVQIHFVINSPRGAVIDKAAERFGDLVKQRTKGGVEVQVFPSATMGKKKFSQLEIPQSVASGEIEMGYAGTSNFANYSPEFGVFDLPYLFRDNKQFDDVLDGPIGKKLMEKLLPYNLVGLGYIDITPRMIVTKNVEIHHPSDVKGLRLRIMEGPVYESLYKTWGAVPVPTPILKVPESAQKGYIQGEDQSYPIYWEYGHTAFFHVVNETYHCMLSALLVTNKNFFQKLPKAYQTAIKTSAQDAAMFERKLMREKMEEEKKLCIAKGIKIVTLTPAERKEFERSAKPVYAQFTPLIGKDLIDSIKNTR